MKLSQKHQAVFDERYPDGYSLQKVTPRTGESVDESGYFHIMYIDIRKAGKRTRDVPCVQKYSVQDWEKTKKIIEGKGSIQGGISVTGHDEYAILHDPTVKAEAREAKAEVKPEGKRPGRPPQK
jgi:hypothetical protein